MDYYFKIANCIIKISSPFEIFWNKYINKFRIIGLNIAYYRKLRGLTQLQLAELVNVSRTHISNIEAPNMPTSISLEKLFDIADVLNIPPTYLLDDRSKIL